MRHCKCSILVSLLSYTLVNHLTTDILFMINVIFFLHYFIKIATYELVFEMCFSLNLYKHAGAFCIEIILVVSSY